MTMAAEPATRRTVQRGRRLGKLEGGKCKLKVATARSAYRCTVERRTERRRWRRIGQEAGGR